MAIRVQREQEGVWRAWDLTPDQHTDAARQVDVITARARRRGFTGAVAVAGRARIVRTDDPLLGARELVVVRSWFEGCPAAYGGWEVLAALEARTDGSVGVEAAAGAARVWDVDRAGVRPGVCESCGTARAHRRVTYLLARPGERACVCVGKTCLSSFVGVEAPVFLGEWDLADQLGWGAVGQAWSVAFTVPTVLAHGYAAVRAFGWSGAAAIAARVTTALSARKDPSALRTKTAMLEHIAAGRAWAADVAIAPLPEQARSAGVAAVAPLGAVTARQVPQVVREIPRLLRHSAVGGRVLEGEAG